MGKQQYLMRRRDNRQLQLFRAALWQYNYQGDESIHEISDDWPWRDYRSDLWFDFLSDNDASDNLTTLRSPSTTTVRGLSLHGLPSSGV